MKLSEFKKQLKQLEDKLLTEYNLSDEEIEELQIGYYDWLKPFYSENTKAICIESLNIEGTKDNYYIYVE